jgi:hypothetical protein
LKNSALKFYSFLSQDFLRANVCAAPFVVLRWVFGMLMAGGTIRFLSLGWVEDHYIQPVFHFRYFGFGWVPVFSGTILYGIHYLMIASAICLSFGWWYRISACVLFLSFTYTELIDLSYYLNHYYFVSLACLLFCLAPIPVRHPDFPRYGSVPRWSLGMFRLLICIVYLYAGLAKINTAWLLEALPLKIWLPAHDNLLLIGPLLALKSTAYIFSWAGMLYDCSIPFLLMWSRSRPLAFALVVIFHLITGILFQIGVFPVVMMGAALVFFSAPWHRNLLSWLRFIPAGFTSAPLRPVTQKIILGFLILFFGFQILFPWRYLLYPGNIFFTEQGYRFSWRVMLMEKAGTAQFYVKDGKTGREGLVVNSDFLNIHQEKQMAMQPDMILQFAHFLGAHYAALGMSKPRVRAEVYVTLNGKPGRLLINPHADLMKEEDGWEHKKWILPDEN